MTKVDPHLAAGQSVSAPLARFRERRAWLTDAVPGAAKAGAVPLSRAQDVVE
jgi:hypothetical protein